MQLPGIGHADATGIRIPAFQGRNPKSLLVHREAGLDHVATRGAEDEGVLGKRSLQGDSELIDQRAGRGGYGRLSDILRRRVKWLEQSSVRIVITEGAMWRECLRTHLGEPHGRTYEE